MKWLIAALLAGALVVTGCRTTKRDYTPVVARFFLESSVGQASGVALPQSGVQLTISPKPVFTEFDIVDVQEVQVELGRCLMFRLTPAAARDLYRLTASNQGRRLVVLLNGVALGARRIDAPFEEGVILIFVEAPDGELAELARNLRATSAELQRAAGRS